MSCLRVLLVGPLPPPQGGMANQTRQLAALLADAGFAVETVQVNPPYRPRWVERVPGLRAVFRFVPYLAALWRACGRADVMHLMANSGWSWHLFAAPAVLIARMRGLPVLVNYRGGQAGPFLERQSRWVLPVLRRADMVAVPSGFLAEVFAGYSIECRIIPNVVDLERFGAHRREAMAEASLQLAVTRNLEPIYDNHTALRAFALIRERWPTARLVVAGSGPELESLQGAVSELGLGDSVSFPGRLERDEVARLYADSHIMLNASRVDNTPNSILEAWASGVAVVSTNVGGIPYLADDGVNAVLVPPRDARALADAALRLLEAPAEHERLVAEGRHAAERYSWTRVAPILTGAYRELAGANGVTDVRRSA